MKPRLLRLGGELFWVALGQALVAVGGLLGVRLLTEVLPPDSYGELALAMTVVTFVQVTIQQPIFEAARRFFVAAGQTGETRGFLEALRRFAARVSVFLAGAGLAGAATLVGFDQGRWVPLAVAALGVCLVSTWSLTTSGILNASRQRAVVAGQEGIQQWLRFGLAAGLVWWIGPHSSAAMAGYGLAGVCVLAYQRGFLPRSPPGPPRGSGRSAATRAWEARILAYAWPFALWGAALSLQMASARWSLQVFEAPAAVGLYAAVFHVGHYPIALLIGILLKFASPIIFNRAGIGRPSAQDAETRRLGHLLVAAALGATLFATVVALLAHEIVFGAVVAREYRSVSWLLPVQILGSGLLVSAQSASVPSMISADPQALVRPRVASAAIGIALNVAGAWIHGLPGVVFAGVAYGAISCVWIAGWSERSPARSISRPSRLP